jgi:hypothetical protein
MLSEDRLPSQSRWRDAMTHQKEYFWIVMCKNHRYHFRQNRVAGHPVLLGQTDPFSAPPRLEFDFMAKCDDCGKEYAYSPADLLRFETESPESFVAHSLFADF